MIDRHDAKRVGVGWCGVEDEDQGRLPNQSLVGIGTDHGLASGAVAVRMLTRGLGHAGLGKKSSESDSDTGPHKTTHSQPYFFRQHLGTSYFHVFRPF